jgi:hypothetical protein
VIEGKNVIYSDFANPCVTFHGSLDAPGATNFTTGSCSVVNGNVYDDYDVGICTKSEHLTPFRPSFRPGLMLYVVKVVGRPLLPSDVGAKNHPPIDPPFLT